MSSMWTENEERRREQVLARTWMAVGIALLISLIFICLRLAYLRAGASNNPFGRMSRSTERTLLPEDGSGGGMDYSAAPGSPSGHPAASLPSGGAGNFTAPPAAPVYSPPPLPATGGGGAFLDISADREERELLRAALHPLRETLATVRATDSRISQRLSQLTSAEQEQQQGRAAAASSGSGNSTGVNRLAAARAMPLDENAADGGTRQAAVPTPNPEPIRRQILLELEGLSGLVTLTGHPQRYPAPVREGVDEAAAAMRAYVMLSETAVGSAERRNLLRQEAARHLSRSQQILSRLESGTFEPTEPQ